MRARRTFGSVLMLLAVGFAMPGVPVARAADPRQGSTVSVDPLCAASTEPGLMACFALRRSDVTPKLAGEMSPMSVPYGYGPADLQSAYALPGESAGAGVTVAIVDAYDLPTAEADLAVYRAQYGLPPCTTANGCFRKVDQRGGTTYPVPEPNWGGEIALDMDMVSAACPACNILLVEADSPYMTDLGTAVNTAVSLGAVAVSNSFGGPESPNASSYDAAYFRHPGIAVTASTGDCAYHCANGAEAVNYPAASQYVVAVGGTKLVRDTSARGWTETAWGDPSNGGAGSGCSAYETKPGWQSDPSCANRMQADVSAVADPATGVAVYDSGLGGWEVYGGTSASAPIIAAIYAMAPRPGASDYPARFLYENQSDLNDVVGGSNDLYGDCAVEYFCNGVAGYDGPTGLGTPIGTAAFAPASAAPGKPLGVHATAGSRSALVEWTPPTTGGSAAYYTVTASPGGVTCTTSGTSCDVRPLTAGTAYTFTVSGTNSVGTGPTSDPSVAVTPFVRAPDPPTGVHATPAASSATVTWTAAEDYGDPITQYVVTSNSGSHSCAWTAGPLGCTLTGLANGTPYTFTVTATSSSGTSLPSAPSNEVTPVGGWTVTLGASATTVNKGDDVLLTAVASQDVGPTPYLIRIVNAAAAEISSCTGGTICTTYVTSDVYASVTYHAVVGDGSTTVATSNPVTVTWGVPSPPQKPTNVTAVPRLASAIVSWAAPYDAGGAAITAYTVTASPGGWTCGWSGGPLQCTVGSLTNGTAYTFTVTATNAEGTGPASDPSAPVTPNPTTPWKPTSLVASRGNGSATVSWIAPTDNGGSAITGYTVTSQTTADSCTWIGGPLSCTVNGLVNGQAYRFVVTARNALGAGEPSDPSNQVIPAAVPGRPTHVTALPGNRSALVSWDAPADDGGVAITSYTATMSPGGVTCTTATTSCNFTQLDYRTTYTFTVTASNAAGTSVPSDPSAGIRPTLDQSSSPAGTAVASGYHQAQTFTTGRTGRLTRVDLFLEATAGQDVHVYIRAVDPTGNPTGPNLASAGVSLAATTARWVAFDLATPLSVAVGSRYAVVIDAGTAQQVFTYKGSAYGGGAAMIATNATDTAWSKQDAQGNYWDWAFRTYVDLPGAPGAPTSVSGVRGDASVVVSWSAPADDGGGPITSYTVTASPGGRTCTWTGGPLSCTVTSLANGTAYTFTAIATNDGGSGPASAPSAPVTPAGLPGAPTGVVATRGDGQATVSWSAASANGSAISGYTVTSSPGGKTCSTAGVLTCPVANLINGTAYTFTVRATNAVGTGPVSGPSAPVTPAAVPAAPPSVVVTRGDGQVTVSWSAAAANGSPVTGYAVTSSPEGKTCTTSGALTCPVTNLTNGTAYTFTVQATNALGTGPSSAPSAAVTPAGVPGAPAAVTAARGDRQIAVSWSAAAANGSPITGYTVTSSPEGKTCTTTGALTCTVASLTNGTTYTFTVRASNAIGPGAASAPSSAATPVALVQRYAGTDRFSTAAQISAHTFAADCGCVAYIAYAFNFPDALAGAAAAGSIHGPVLLVATAGAIDPSTAAELARLKPSKVVVLGSEGVISKGVYDALAAFAPTITRYYGADRFGTAVAISAHTFAANCGCVAYIATAFNFPDALAGAAAAGKVNGPVLLVSSTGIDATTVAELQRLQPTRIVVLGSEGVVPGSVYNALAAYAPSIARYSGADRFATAAAISANTFAADCGCVAYIATAFNFPDALAGAAAAGTVNGPVLLAAPTGEVNAATAAELTRLRPLRIVVLGSEGVVSASVFDALRPYAKPMP